MLEALKQQVYAANLALVQHGLVTLTWGNASGVDREAGCLVIKPSGISYAAMKPEEMVVVDLASGERVGSHLNPSSDTKSHLVLYRAWPEVGGIVHTHSAHACMFAQAARGIPCFGTTHADHFHGEVPVTRSLTAEEVNADYETATGEVILERFAQLDPVATPAVLVANHGPFTWGPSVDKAVANAVALEAVAQMALGSLQLAPTLEPLPQHLIDKHHARKHGPAAYYGQARSGD